MKRINLSEKLATRSIRPSHQRIRILEFLAANKSHPTADEIYTALKPEMPTLSKSTVYNTMGAFVQERLVRQVTIEDNEVRYDADMDSHGHFKCTACGAVYDFGFDLDGIPAEGLDGFRIDAKHVYFKGVCPKCL